MNRLRNIGIIDRLVIGFALMLLILAGALGVTQYLFDESAMVQQEVTERVLPQSEAAQQLEQAILYVGIGVRGYLLVGGAQLRDQYSDNARTARERLVQLHGLTRSEARRALLARTDSATRAYLAVADSLVNTSVRFDSDVELALRERRELALVPLREFIAQQRESQRVAMENLAASRNSVQQGLVLALLGGVALAIIIAVVTSESVRSPTRELLRVADALRKGDWEPARQLVRDTDPEDGEDTPTRNELVRIGRAFGTAGIALERRDRRLRSTNTVCTATASSLDSSEIASAVLQEACDYLRAEVGVVYVRDNADDLLVPVATRSVERALPSLRYHEGIPGEAAATGKTLVVSDIPADTPFRVGLGFDAVPPRSVVAVPFFFNKSLRGVMLIASVRRQHAADIEFLEAAAAQLGVGVENARAYETVQQLLAEVEAQRERIADQLEQLQGQHEELQAQHEEIQSQSEELQVQSEEIQSQNEELQAQTNALIEADEQKNRFLGLLAHELRNPMAAISNSLYLLSQAGDVNPMTARARSIIERQTTQLVRLVDDLLDITRIARGKLHIERAHVDFGPIVRDCVDDHRAAAAAAGVTLDCVLPETPLPVFGDSVRLRQVVGNLLDNGIKFCASGGSVNVWCDTPTEAGEIVMTVTDDGIGIDPSVQEQLFKPFMQADPSRTRSKGGLGLGLSLVKAYVTLHGGSVSMKSDGVGAGCQFTVRLPLDVAVAPEPPSAIVAGDASRALAETPCRVLVVEDDSDGAESLRAALVLDGHDVRVAASVEKALEITDTFTPDVALCDLGLPGMDGYEFARRVRQNARLESMRIVALTGYAAPEDKQRAADAGFDSHLTKPASIHAIRSLLDQAAAPQD